MDYFVYYWEVAMKILIFCWALFVPIVMTRRLERIIQLLEEKK